MLHIIVESPSQFVVLVFLPAEIPNLLKAMAISAGYVQDFSEQALLSHAERVHLKPVVHTVLQKHAVLSRALACVYQVPDIFHIQSTRNLDCGVLAMVHGAESSGHMMKPVGSNVDEIYVGALAELHIAGVTIIDSGLRKMSFLQKLLAVLGTLFLMIAECNDLHAGNIHPALYCAGSAPTCAYKAYSYNLELRRSQIENIRLSGRALRGFYDNSTFLPMPVASVAQCPLRICIVPANHRKENEGNVQDFTCILHHSMVLISPAKICNTFAV